ncbi:MAG: hypothetical protein ABSG29_03260 [Steroidobacteraceae bacterium]
MTFHFSWFLGLLILTLVVAIPMKVGAHLVSAQHTGIIRCGFAAFVGLLGGVLASLIFGGIIGPSLAWILGFILAIRTMLGTTFLGAIGLMLMAWLVSLLGFWLLVKFGLFLAGPVTSAVSI